MVLSYHLPYRYNMAPYKPAIKAKLSSGDPMTIEVDQSNKIERTNKDTILAFSDDDHFCIIIPAKTKRDLIDFLRKEKSQKAAYLQVFAAGLFILLRSVLAKREIIIIDTEYSGHEAIIKSMFLRHAYSAGIEIPIVTSINGTVLTITPGTFLTADKYVLTLYNGSFTDLVGNPLALWSINFNTTGLFTIDSIADAAGTVKSYIDTNHTLPGSVVVSGLRWIWCNF